MTIQECEPAILKSITFNDGQTLTLNHDSIVVFVGPNNVGKSQALADIHGLLKTPDCHSVVVEAINVNALPIDQVETHLEQNSIPWNENGHPHYKGFGFFINQPIRYVPSDSLGIFTDAYCVKVDTQRRLDIVTSAAPGGRHELQHPLDFLFKETPRKILRNSFQHAFGTSIVADPWFGMGANVRVGNPISVPSDHVDEDTVFDYLDELGKLPKLSEQGDGMKSFAGTIMYLMLDYIKLFLFDEPEAFLHPPQARVMGQCLGEGLDRNQQAFISTHSKDVILGLLEKCSNRVKVVRITRSGDTNSFSVLENEEISSLWNDPLLKNSNILDSLFFESVALCEADADSQFYRLIKESLDERDGVHSECLFLHCGGKARMPKVVKALTALNVPTNVVADFDLLESEETLKGLSMAQGGNWDEIAKTYKQLRDSLPCPKRKSKAALLGEIERVLAPADGEIPDSCSVGTIRDMLKQPKRWGELSKHGIDAIPSGNQRMMCERLVEQLRELRINLVPCGEMERFIPSIGGHGPQWLNNAIEKHPDLNGPVYNEARRFVESWS